MNRRRILDLSSFHFPVRAALLLALVALALAAPARAQGVHVALLPATQSVLPGTDFDITIDVTSAGSAFNGFDAVVQYDPAALTFVPLVPVSLQQGCLMTGGCSAACGNTFHVFSADGDSLVVNDVLLCNQIALTGPGHIYVLRFHASNTPQITDLTLRRAKFYNGGLFVTPVVTTGCRVGIGVSVGAVARTSASGLLVSAEPNPSHGRVSLGIRSESSGLQRVEVLDLQGRTVRHLSSSWTSGDSRLEWDGRDDAGNRLAAGVYLIRARVGDRSDRTRVTLLP